VIRCGSNGKSGALIELAKKPAGLFGNPLLFYNFKTDL